MLQTEYNQDSTEVKYDLLKLAFSENNKQMFDEQRHDLLYELNKREDISISMDELLQWPIIDRDEDGWRICEKSTLKFYNKPYQCIQGFSINLKNGEFQIDLLEGNNHLFTLLDLDYILKGGIDQMFFSLDPPKDHLQIILHVCNELRFGPWTLSDGDILSTMFHTDYLLKMFAMGVEIQCQYPYQIRSVYDGLMSRLPQELQEALKPIHLRGINIQSLSRFWIESDVIEINQQQKNEILQIQFGRAKMIVKQHLMKRNDDGSLSDDNRDSSSDNTPESNFANDFTRSYDRIAEYFPEFDRLKEISKMLYISKVLKQFKSQFMESKVNIQQIETTLDKIQEQVSNQYPQVQKFEEILLKHLQSQGINDESKVEPNNLKQVKQQLKQSLEDADKHIINEVIQVLSQQFYSIKLTNVDIIDWLEGYNSIQTKQLSKKKFSEKILAHMQSKKSELEALMNQVFFEPIQEQNQEYIEAQDKLRWVPAAYLSYQQQQKIIQCYGGVALHPNSQNVPDQKIIDFYRNSIQSLNTEKQTLSQKQYIEQIQIGMNGGKPPQDQLTSLFKKETDEQNKKLENQKKIIVQQMNKEQNSLQNKKQNEISNSDKSKNQQKQQVQNQQYAHYETIQNPAVENLKGQGQEVKRVSSSAQVRLSTKDDPDIDIQFVNDNEKPSKEDRLRGIVPSDKNGKPLGKSGVTVGNGYDIGQHSVQEINRLNISEDLKQKLKPYCLVKKENAQQLLKQKPLLLTEQEVNQINQAVHPEYKGLFLKKMQKHPEFYNSLTSEQKTALYDYSYHQGAEKLAYFEKAFEQNDKELALQLLENFTNLTSYKTRNKDRIKLWKSGNNQKPICNMSPDDLEDLLNGLDIKLNKEWWQ